MTEKARLTLDLDPEMHLELKLLATQTGTTMREICILALRRYLTPAEEGLRIAEPVAVYGDRPQTRPSGGLTTLQPRAPYAAGEAAPPYRNRTVVRQSEGPHYLTAEEAPLLAALWDNDEDAVYDEL